MKSLIQTISRTLEIGAGYLLLVLLFAQIIVVALRYVFAIGWPWAMDLLVYLFFLSVLLPGLGVLYRNRSVRVDVFYAAWGKRRRRWLDRFSLLALMVPAMGHAAWASLQTTLSSWRVLESSPTFGGLPGYFLLKTALTLFFALLTLLALYMALSAEPYDEGASL